ncbi:hypothetical protein GGS21DRAFT_491863 [Xylaria nigripes]|nr:hypothetical protein GGS21DRAFT_491863 [Xylaria nigripes]
MASQSMAELEEGLKEATRQLYDTDPNTVTVNSVRQHAEEQNGLEQGFFTTLDWKARSKTLITEFVQTLIEDDSPQSTPDQKVDDDSNNVAKRSLSDEPCPSPEVKRRRKAASSAKARNSKQKREPSSSALSDLTDSDVEDKPGNMKMTTTKKATAKKQESDSELSDLDFPEDELETEKKVERSAASEKSKAEESESELSDLSDFDDEPKTTKKGGGRSKKLKDLDDGKPSKSQMKRKQPAPKKKQGSKRAKIESDSEEEEPGATNTVGKREADTDVKVDRDIPAKDKDLEGEKGPAKNENKATVDDSDSSLSSVLDETPPQKRKGKQAKGAPKSKSSASKELTGDEAEIKRLQGQLVKCGVRKIWGVELKKYSSDNKGKIRHLKDMLHDVGMTGRFSEAKAREIRERRELMGELEAVNEMNELWGLEGRGGRASRSKATRKTLREEPSGDEHDGDEQEPAVNGVKVSTNLRVSKRMADLAFLGSDSESE